MGWFRYICRKNYIYLKLLFMKTNEQSKNEQFVKESLILKGIANNLLSMQFPKLNNLVEMLRCFDYELKIETKIFESTNEVVAFFQKHREVLSILVAYENDISKRTNSYNGKSNVYTGLLKKIVLCENTISLYANSSNVDLSYNYGKQLIDFDRNDERYMRIIDFLSDRGNVFAPNLPIFKYDDKTYSIGEQIFDSESELIDFYVQKKENVFVYQFRILNDNSIIVRSCFEKK